MSEIRCALNKFELYGIFFEFRSESKLKEKSNYVSLLDFIKTLLDKN